ncbi:MAG: phosphopantetheine-binding protein, partial [Dehalococcoidia bacterium]
VDTQVKLRGFRIELGEIEAVLERHPEIRQAAVLLREDTPGDPRLAAYIVAEPEVTLTGNDWRGYLQEHLPGYMVPSTFVSLEAMPLTPNQKVDRRALPQPAPSIAPAQEFFAEPSNDLEKAIAAIWQELLGVDRISVYDNFFDLGGHSLLSMQFIAQLNKIAGIKIEPREMIMQTLGQLAAAHQGETPATPSGSGWGGLTRKLFGSVRGAVSGQA